eukprot:3375993-Rhodomonas_salina.1
MLGARGLSRVQLRRGRLQLALHGGGLGRPAAVRPLRVQHRGGTRARVLLLSVPPRQLRLLRAVPPLPDPPLRPRPVPV